MARPARRAGAGAAALRPIEFFYGKALTSGRVLAKQDVASTGFPVEAFPGRQGRAGRTRPAAPGGFRLPAFDILQASYMPRYVSRSSPRASRGCKVLPAFPEGCAGHVRPLRDHLSCRNASSVTSRADENQGRLLEFLESANGCVPPQAPSRPYLP